MLWDRRLPRIAYEAPVKLVVGGWPRMAARTRNLSERGMFIETVAPMEIGEPVQLELPLGDGRATIAGRVAWRQAGIDGASAAPENGNTASAGGGVGIELVDLDQDAARLLRALVGGDLDQATHPVRLWFGDRAPPLASRASLTDRGIAVSMALPFLEPDAPVRFGFARGGATFRGRIASPAITAGVAGGPSHVTFEVIVDRDGVSSALDERDGIELGPYRDSSRPTRAANDEVSEVTTGRLLAMPIAPRAITPRSFVPLVFAAPPATARKVQVPMPPPLPADDETADDDLDRVAAAAEAELAAAAAEAPRPPLLFDDDSTQFAAPRFVPSSDGEATAMATTAPGVAYPTAPPDADERARALAAGELDWGRPGDTLPGISPDLVPTLRLRRSIRYRRWMTAAIGGSIGVVLAVSLGLIGGDGGSELAAAMPATPPTPTPPPTTTATAPMTPAAPWSSRAESRAPAPTRYPTSLPGGPSAPARSSPRLRVTRARPPLAAPAPVAPPASKRPAPAAPAVRARPPASSSAALIATPPSARAIGGAVQVVIPLDGSLHDLRHYALAGPDGIAIVLPGATSYTTGSVPLAVGRVERAWIRPLGDGVHIRIFTAGGVPDYRVEPVRGGVRVTVMAGNRALPALAPSPAPAPAPRAPVRR